MLLYSSARVCLYVRMSSDYTNIPVDDTAGYHSGLARQVELVSKAPVYTSTKV